MDCEKWLVLVILVIGIVSGWAIDALINSISTGAVRRFYKKNRKVFIAIIKMALMPFIVTILFLVRAPRAITTAAKEWWRY